MNKLHLSVRLLALLLLALLLLLSCSGRKVGTLSFVSLDEETTLGREIAIQTPMLTWAEDLRN